MNLKEILAGEDQKIYQGTNEAKKDTNNDAFESVLEHIGGMGLYQKLLFLAMGPFGIFCAVAYYVQMFVAATPQDHWCRVHELQHLDIELRRNLTIPVGLAEDGRCWTYKTNWSQVLETTIPPGRNTTIEPCKDGWEFRLNDIPYHTVVSDRGWVCENAGNVPTAQAVSFLGSLVGTLFFGWLADRCGRVPALVGANLMGFVGGVASVFTSGLWDFAFCRFLVGLSLDSNFMLMYILVLEYVGASHRTWVANMSIALYCGLTGILLPWLAIWLSDWRKLLLATSIPMAIALGVPFVVPESARWLASKGKTERAVKILKSFEKVNGTKVPEAVLDEFVESMQSAKKTDESIGALIKSSGLRRAMTALLIAYIGLTTLFDGLVRIYETMAMNTFLFFSISSATEIPSLTLLTLVLDRWGRKVLTCGTITIAGTLCIIGAFLPKGMPQVVLALAARFCANMTYNTLMQWATEILPTPVRASGSSILHVLGFFGGILSPFIVYAGRFWASLPLLLFGISAFVACSMALLLPETMGRPLPQTIADGERLFQENSILRRPSYKGSYRSVIDKEEQYSMKL